MSDENGGLTSSVYGQDVYRLNEGPPDLVHRKQKVDTPHLFTDAVINEGTTREKKPKRASKQDAAEKWLVNNGPLYGKQL